MAHYYTVVNDCQSTDIFTKLSNFATAIGWSVAGSTFSSTGESGLLNLSFTITGNYNANVPIIIETGSSDHLINTGEYGETTGDLYLCGNKDYIHIIYVITSRITAGISFGTADWVLITDTANYNPTHLVIGGTSSTTGYNSYIKPIINDYGHFYGLYAGIENWYYATSGFIPYKTDYTSYYYTCSPYNAKTYIKKPYYSGWDILIPVDLVYDGKMLGKAKNLYLTHYRDEYGQGTVLTYGTDEYYYFKNNYNYIKIGYAFKKETFISV